jgi:signal transduction histidine kinase
MRSISLFFLLGTLLFSATNKELLTGNYLYKFVQYTTWPQHGNHHIHIISKDRDLFKAIKVLLHNQHINNKKFILTHNDTSDIPSTASLIFIANDRLFLYENIFKKTQGKPLLLVSQEYENKRLVMINLFETDEQNIRFEINSANILNQNLKIDPKIILLGGTELDVAKLYQGAQETLQKKDQALEKATSLTTKLKQEIKKRTLELKNTQKIIKANQQKVDELKYEILNSNTQASKLKRELLTLKIDRDQQQKEFNRQQQRLSKQHDEFQRQKKRIDSQNSAIKIQEKEMRTIIKDLKKMQADYQNANSALKEMTFVLDDKTNQIDKKEQKLLSLSQKISKKTSALKMLQASKSRQDSQIEKQEETIESQQNFLIALSVAIFIFLALVFVIYRNLKREHKISLSLKLKTKELSHALIELEKTQEELIESEKMASLGGLVAGVAHELNTPLGLSITGITQIKYECAEIQTQLDNKKLRQSSLVDYINTTSQLASVIEMSLNKGSDLIKSFKQVAVDQEVEEKREFYLNEYISTLLISFHTKFRHSNIEVRNSIDEDIFINSYPGVYYQIITNFINNSLLHAFTNDTPGTITLTGFIENRTLYLTYQDNGVGVSEIVLSKIFEPFYTTKRANGGTGLGLHIIYNLVTQKLKGKIRALKSEHGGLQLELKIPI